jgi:pimeloyl-ACP methyl ester carboxylesterase
MEMEKVASRDGTPIAFWRSGEGPPLLLVHGASSDHEIAWRFVVPTLERYFTVFAMDRRGRGESGDSPAYAIQREFEDIAALVDYIGPGVDVVGHSYGALCALEAALITRNVRRLALYEGGISSPRVDVYRPGVLAHMDDLMRQGDRDGVLTVLMQDVVGMSASDVSVLRAQPTWIGRLANAHTVPRELRSDCAYEFDAARFRELPMPTLLLLGSDSPPADKSDAETLAATLPNASIALLAGQGHAAMNTAPDLFIRIVGDFLTD